MLPLDCHAHIQPDIGSRDLDLLGACVIAVTRTLNEYVHVRQRRDRATVWGLGAHPGVPEAHDGFSAHRFRQLLRRAPVVGEIGLDGRSKVNLKVQQRTFNSVLSIVAEQPRLTSIHSVAASGHVLDAIAAVRYPGVVLHWWRGTEAETQRALELNCYFSINAAEIVDPKVLHLLPRDRVLIETDHPFGDRSQTAPRRPGRVADVENALAKLWGVEQRAVRRQVWANLRLIVTETKTVDAFPASFVRNMLAA